MPAEHIELVARRIAEELFNQGHLSAADELIAPNAIDHNEPLGTDCREHFKHVATMLRSAFPDLHMHIEDLIAEEDKVALRITISGTHTGPGAFAGLPPSGKRFQIQQMRFARFANGQMTESWAIIDMFAWMQQLGALPARGSGEALLRGH
ncbi:MAG TPA: ester cyclase [Ktedonobacter sp.]|nr:ester cyclase [Ktedonobacter sp.]